MNQFLQLLGGTFFLLNKVFLSCSEHVGRKGKKASARKWRIAAWVASLIGLPPWVILFIGKHNWIAASMEMSGAPAMVLALVIAVRGTEEKPPRWLDILALICISAGFGYSLYDFGGLKTLNQWLEIALVIGFLIGTYLLAKVRRGGYLWYILMHVACGWLMWIQQYPWLFAQQAVSLVFIVYAYIAARKQKPRGGER